MPLRFQKPAFTLPPITGMVLYQAYRCGLLQHAWSTMQSVLGF